jgi:hypothetical protein
MTAPRMLATSAWSDDGQLVVPLNCRIDDCCFRCGEPTARSLVQTAYWHPAIWYLLLLVGLLPYAIAASIIQHRVKLVVGLCEGHRRSRRRGYLIGGALVAAGFGVLILAIKWSSGFLGALCPILLLAGACVLVVTSNLIKIKRADNSQAWLKGASPALVSAVTAMQPFVD